MSHRKLNLRGSSIVLLALLCIAQSKTVKYFTYEEDAPGTEIGNLSRDLKIDPAEDPQTSFRFMQKAGSSFIRMREIDGLLTTGERIDREKLCGQSPRCLITFDIISFSKEKFQLIHVEIEVKDINDNSPQFPHNETYIDISESAAVGTRFPLDIAVDQDVGPNYIQSYHITFNSHFGIEVHSREDGVKFAELVLLKELDRETEDSYTLKVSAVDGGNPPVSGLVTVQIKVLDFNDNSPVFEHSKLKVELYEDAPVGYLLLKLNAFDPDEGKNGEVVYGFVEELSYEIKQVFQIDPASGHITLREQVDYEKKKTYELNIQAYDLGLNSVPSTCKVIVEVVDVNDNAPEIRIKPMTSMNDGIAYITEAAAEDSFVALVSTSDRDSGANGYVQCSLQGHWHFRLQQAYGDTFMIVTTAALDREKTAEYNLTVIAEDLGSPPFKTIKQYTIRVGDENDNAPLFGKPVYEVSVKENNAPGSYITTVVARDLDLGHNGQVTYKLIDGDVLLGSPLSTFVSLDPVSGALYAVRSFNYELIKQIEVTIQASDGGFPQLTNTALIRVKIEDQNDNAPLIVHPILQNSSADVPIPYNAPSSYLAVQIKARDSDEGVNGEVSYRILEDPQMLFSINKQTGEIYLKNALTFVCGDMLKVKIAVNDNGRPSLSSTATVRFFVTEMPLSNDQVVLMLPSSVDTHSEMDVSLIVIIMLGGGCAVLLIAIISVAVSCKINSRGRNYAAKKDSSHRIFERNPLSMHSPHGSSIFIGSRVIASDQVASSRDGDVSSCLYEEGSEDSETRVFLPNRTFSPKHFEPTTLWHDEKFSLQLSGIGNTDQLSVKDSGKGDSDFNDSDSDISGEGSKKFPSTFNPRPNGTTQPPISRSADSGERYCVIPTHANLSCRNGYTISFSQAPAYNQQPYPSSWRDSCYRTNIPKTKGLLQAIPRTGTLPAQFCHHGAVTRTADIEKVNDCLSAPTPLSEVATSF
uniref:Protocadherin-8 n=1 Tax=Lepisosteus oculatus TaxID=7918 RepID=W5MD93_LEPOC|nr:PREDICTED: protocadherin-8-like [Lepisosteus oculatus]